MLAALFALAASRLPAEGAGRPIVFALGAAGASLALLIPLGARVAPYYGSMMAFWLSVAGGLALVQLGRKHTRATAFAFSVLLLAGFAEIRLKQIALLPPGGYVWGTYGMDRERVDDRALGEVLRRHPRTRTVVLVDPPENPSYFAGMLLLESPPLERIFAYRSATKLWVENDRGGRRPGGDWESLTDARAFNWDTEASRPETRGSRQGEASGGGEILWIGFPNGSPKVVPPASPAGWSGSATR